MCRPDGRPGSRHWARHRAITGACGTVGYCGCACSTCWVGHGRERGPDEGEGRMRAARMKARARAGCQSSRGRVPRGPWCVRRRTLATRPSAAMASGHATAPGGPSSGASAARTVAAYRACLRRPLTCKHNRRADAGVGVGLVARRRGLVEGVKQRTKQRGRERSQGQRHGRHVKERERGGGGGE